jgi:mannose-1-phosphate guanylyltransferase
MGNEERALQSNQVMTTAVTFASGRPQAHSSRRISARGAHNQWAVVLAGGEGRRLESFTSRVHGDTRPKQFSVVVGNDTLLGLTVKRTEELIPSKRTVVLLSQHHSVYYKSELPSLAGCHLLIQPHSRGTGPAIWWSVVEIAKRDPDAVIAILPSDHFYANEESFLASLEAAYEEASKTGQVILVGAQATSAETSYGWIEVANDNWDTNTSSPIARFWEKPTPAIAEALFRKGCLWNTFVTVGSVAAFRRLVKSAAPALCSAFESTACVGARGLSNTYERLQPTDFSRDILVPHYAALRAMPLGDVGWSDLGQPQRAMAVAAAYGTSAQREFIAELSTEKKTKTDLWHRPHLAPSPVHRIP